MASTTMTTTTSTTPPPYTATPTAVTPAPPAPSAPPSVGPSAGSAPLARTVSRAESTRSTAGVAWRLDPNRPKFKLKPRAKKEEAAAAAARKGGPTESVANFSRDEYFGQRPLYAAAFLAGYFIGSPDLAMNVVKAAEKGVVKVTGLSADPIGDKRERKRKAALAKLSAMDEYGVVPPVVKEEEEAEAEAEGEERSTTVVV